METYNLNMTSVFLSILSRVRFIVISIGL